MYYIIPYRLHSLFSSAKFHTPLKSLFAKSQKVHKDLRKVQHYAASNHQSINQSIGKTHNQSIIIGNMLRTVNGFSRNRFAVGYIRSFSSTKLVAKEDYDVVVVGKELRIAVRLMCIF
jgi:hypothetical protein